MKTAPTDHFPTFKKAAAAVAQALRRLRRLFFSRTSLKCYLITASLICLTYTTLRWVGRRALQAEKERVAALGMATEWKQLLTPMLPDKDNFLAAPPFAGLFSSPKKEAPELAMWFGFHEKKNEALRDEGKKLISWPEPHQDTLQEWCGYFRKVGALPTESIGASPAEELIGDQRWQSTIQAVYAAAKRPESRFPEVGTFDDLSVLGITPALHKLLRSLQLYSRAQLQLGNLDQALPIFRVIHHLVKAGLVEPRRYGAVWAANYCLDLQRQILLEGIKLHQFPVLFLRELLQEDYQTQLQHGCRRGYEVDRLHFIQEHENYASGQLDEGPALPNLLRKTLLPDYLYTRSAVRSSQFYSQLFVASRPLEEHEAWFTRKNLLSQPENQKVQFFRLGDPRDLFWASPMLPITRACLRQIVIALEIHYLEHQRYPSTLEALRSSLPTRTLTDIDGQPFRYSTNEAGSHFTLGSVGQNGLVDAAGNKKKDDLIFSTAPGPTAK